MNINEIPLDVGETLDPIGKNRYIIQKETEWKFSLDAVLLAHFAERKARRKNIVDLGTGTGILPLLLADVVQAAVGVELRENLAALAERSVALNGLGEKIKIVAGDYRDENLLKTLGREKFDAAIANPPYFKAASGKVSLLEGRDVARRENTAEIDDVAKAVKYLVKYGGEFFLIHHSSRLAEVMKKLLDYDLTPKRLRFVKARASDRATLFLLGARKGGKPGLEMLPDLIVYDGERYSAEVAAYFSERSSECGVRS